MKIVFLILSLCFSTVCISQNAKEENFEKTVQQVITSYNVKSNADFNNLISEKNGVYLLIKKGAYTFWQKQTKINLNEKDSSTKYANSLNTPYNKMVQEQQIMNSISVSYVNDYTKYDCNKQNGPEGVFVSKNCHDHLFSDLIKKYIKKNDIGLSKQSLKKELKVVKKLELKSRKVLILSNDKNGWGKSFIFYLIYENKKWYLSIIDFATLDCSS